ncbi:MAG: hypothetical protein ACT4NY_09130 [Pseudonocardiales bacterium]
MTCPRCRCGNRWCTFAVLADRLRDDGVLDAGVIRGKVRLEEYRQIAARHGAVPGATREYERLIG